MELPLLCLFAFLAGFVDAIVGGGGLIQLPALFLLVPDSGAASLAAVLGTNKFSSICGTGTAVVQYARRVPIPWATMLPAAVTAFLLSMLGARLVSLLHPTLLKPLVLVLLIAVAAHTFLRRSFGERHTPRLPVDRERLLAALAGAVIGFYDGFFGPGTGSFLIFVFIGLLGFDFLTASASAKVVNFATNLSATLYFALTDNILYHFAIPMALCNVAGSLVGTRMAVLRGNRFVRRLFLGVVLVMILRYGWDVFRN